ncbi:hypothetical protein B0H16DRAFT_1460939 [Mycena metata]|uniref:Uncharacterized protein n=1 Tax=Mycena metata TaxID=1033252 RepID=A0AAD7IUV1_9AGAR|nr:hypothetical protein B0H16DRAFT_1460939 [Mycena metata]
MSGFLDEKTAMGFKEEAPTGLDAKGNENSAASLQTVKIETTNISAESVCFPPRHQRKRKIPAFLRAMFTDNSIYKPEEIELANLALPAFEEECNEVGKTG